jgi:NADPH:quinone reductase-like Zn-dependent oxidoreductase
VRPLRPAQAAVNRAVNAGARVIATTRNQQRFAMLQKLGASRAEREGPDLSKRIAEAKQLDAVLDLVGNSTILDSLAMLRRGGRGASQVGWAGSRQSRTSTRCCKWPAASTSPSSAVLCSARRGSRCPDVPVREIAQQVAVGRLKAKPTRVFGFEEIREAHRLMEANEAGGKIEVVLG